MNTEKVDKMVKYISGFNKVAIAFSGGVDSTYLLKIASMALGRDGVLALTVKSPYIPDWEIKEAKAITRKLDVEHIIISQPINESIINNPEDRCYLCKKLLFTKMTEYAKKFGCDGLMDGSNADDTSDYRPGMRALKELKVISPLLRFGLTKKVIREHSKALGLATHDKPAYACLLTRLPHDTIVSPEVLNRIEMAEVYLHSLGIKDVRVRVHGDIARIEINKNLRYILFDESKMDMIDRALKTFGFKYVTMDLAGYKMGSFNNTETS